MNEEYNRWCYRRVVAIFFSIGEQGVNYTRGWCSLITGTVEENSVRILILMTDLDDRAGLLRDVISEKWRKAKKFVLEL